MKITYKTFLKKYVDFLEKNNSSSIKNFRSVLKSFVKMTPSINDKSIIGIEFNEHFEISLVAFLKNYPNLKSTSINSKASILRKINSYYLDKYRPKNDLKLKQFNVVLNKYIEDSGKLISEIAREAKMVRPSGKPNEAIYGWISGKHFPLINKTNTKYIKNLEKVLGIKNNELLSSVTNQKADRHFKDRKRSISRKAIFKILKYKDWPNEIQTEYKKYFKYKTMSILPSGVTRRNKAKWKAGEECYINAGYLFNSPSCCHTAQNFGRYFHFLKSIKKINISFSDLFNTSFIREFLAYIEESRGSFTKSDVAFLASIVALIDGYCPHAKVFDSKIILSDSKLKEVSEDISSIRTQIDEPKLIKSIDVKEPISLILKMKRPKLFLLKMNENAMMAYQSLIDNTTKLRLKRDLIASRILTEKPVRQNNIRLLKINSDDFNSINFDKNTQRWVLNLPDYVVKNGANINFTLSKELSLFITSYVKDRKAVVNNEQCPYLISTLRKDQKNNPLIRSNFVSMFQKFTYQFGENFLEQGFSTHSYRHILATDYLKIFPSAYNDVAILLNDKIETVIKNYAHVSDNDVGNRMENDTKKLLTGIRY